MKRVERWAPVFLILPKKILGEWYWLRRVMRKGNVYMTEKDYLGMVESQEPTKEDISKLYPYTADDILEMEDDDECEQRQ
jgi:hypothetical protein